MLGLLMDQALNQVLGWVIGPAISQVLGWGDRPGDRPRRFIR
jgi:hypothetical protein